jgi:hypothetical protein
MPNQMATSSETEDADADSTYPRKLVLAMITTGFLLLIAGIGAYLNGSALLAMIILPAPVGTLITLLYAHPDRQTRYFPPQ